MLQRTSTVVWCILFLIFPLLAGCASPTPPPPTPTTWAEQMTAARRYIGDANAEFLPVDAAAHPICHDQGSPDAPIELAVYLVMQNQKSSQVDEQGTPNYSGRDVKYNDHQLGTTLESDDEYLLPRHLEDPLAIERANSIQLGPQDALQLTLAEGEAFLGEPVDCGNISISLLGMWVPDSELTDHAAWMVMFYRTEKALVFRVDAQTGDIIDRHEE